MKTKIRFTLASAALKARLELGYTQAEVAEAASISVRWYQSIETGHRLPGTITMLRIMAILNIETKEFRDELGIIIPPSVKRKKLSVR